jgi:hypothetical protein
MSIFVPLQQKTLKEYVRRTTISAFVIIMLWLTSLFYAEYHEAETKRTEAKIAIAKIEESAKSKDTASKPPLQIEPIGGGPLPPPPPQLPKTTPKETVESVPNSRFEIDAGLVKIAMDNEASWSAIFKIVFTLLFTFFGVKLINFGFKRLEGTVST